jgi:sterol desaturase/sphingolipid hydroxylase (fatty acid hydroxylase superfamily)
MPSLQLELHHLIAQAAPWLAHFDARDGLLLALSPLFALALLVEWSQLRGQLNAQGQAIYARQDTLTSLALGGVYNLVDLLWLAVLVLPAMDWVYAHRLATIDISPARFAALYLAVELCYYAFHRASHRVRWFWAAHQVHHSSEHMNFSTAMRQSWFYSPAGNWLFYAPLVLMGFEPRWVLLALSINLAYQFFVHTQWVGKLAAPIEFIFNTPSHHRAHHGRNPRYIDRNYGGTLIVFDRLFGTFVDETEPVEFGLLHGQASANPLRLNVQAWADLFRDVLRPGPLAERLKHLWAPPEWERTRDNPPHASERSSRPHRTARP